MCEGGGRRGRVCEGEEGEGECVRKGREERESV